RNAELFLRPRFSIDLAETSDVVIQRFSDVFKQKKSDCRGVIVDQHIFISVPKKDEHFWSPQLHLEFIQKENNTTELKGLFGPKPQVWTFFMFIHFVVGGLFLISATML
ncbi:GTP-binding protein, partial [Polaribacter sp. BAL334]|nr:GTP-binding protein [Polaribacter sp. BAL334]